MGKRVLGLLLGACAGWGAVATPAGAWDLAIASPRPGQNPAARPSASAPRPSSPRPTARPSARPAAAASARPTVAPMPRPTPTLAPLRATPTPRLSAAPSPNAEGAEAQAQARAWVEGAFFREQAEAVVAEAEPTARREGLQAGPSRWAALGVAYAKQGRWKEAEEALQRGPRTGQVGPLARALVAWYRGEWATAESEAGIALMQQGGDEVARWALASALLHQGRFDAADAALAPLVAHEGSLVAFLRPWVLVVQGGSLGLRAQRAPLWERLRLAPQVKARFEQALLMAPRGPNALSAMGRYHLLAPLPFQNPREALKLLGQADAVDPFFYLNAAHLIQAHLAVGELREARIEAVRYQARFEGCPVAMLELAPWRAKLGVLPF